MRQPKPELTDAQWEKLRRFFPVERMTEAGGRPWADNRAAMEGILWVMRAGARWRDIPEPYPSGVTCWRRLQKWEREGTDSGTPRERGFLLLSSRNRGD